MGEEAELSFQPDDVTTRAPVGETVLSSASKAGVGIESLCGGEGICGTCPVDIQGESDCLSTVSEVEETILTEDELAAGRRLSCRVEIEAAGSVDITVPPVSQVTGGIVLTDGRSLEIDLKPALSNHRVLIDPPSLADNRADRERLIDALAAEYNLDIDDIDHQIQQSLPSTLRNGDDGEHIELTATVYRGGEILDVHPGSLPSMYGLAVDIGTTTVAVYLIDLDTGAVETVSAQLNPQRHAGEDIMSRMRYCRREEDGRERLQRDIITGVNDAIEEVVGTAGIDRQAIYEAVFVGNTAMHHLFLGYDPDYVAGSPYIPARHESITLKARELGIDIHPAGYLHWLPVSGGWVGPDKVSVLLASGHYSDEAMTVCIDIGTNGEISVGNATQTWTTSAPAGPALEGAELTDGVRAQPGAIERVSIDPASHEVSVTTIDDEPAIGICGSGVIDALAQLFLAGIVDRRGTFAIDPGAHPRLRTNADGEVEFVVQRGDAADEEDIVLTQNDIRDVQMAKAAIQAGTRVLMDELGVDTIDRLVIAGGFGNYIDPSSAVTIGLYPEVDHDSITQLGNGAGVGAQLALLDVDARQEAGRIVEQVDYYEIAGTDRFEAAFLQAMYLPHQVFDTYPGVKADLESIRTPIDVEQPRES